MEFEEMLRVVENDCELKQAMDAAKDKDAFIRFLCWCYKLLGKGLKVAEVWNAWVLGAD